MERFFLNLKMERVWLRQYAKHTEAIRDVTDYIFNFYNVTVQTPPPDLKTQRV